MKNIMSLKKRLGDYAKKNLDTTKIESFLDIDLKIDFDDINFEFCDNLKELEPFGKGNEEPIFCTLGCKVISCTVFGKNSDHFKMNVRQGESNFTIIAFSNKELFDKFKVGDIIDLAYTVSINEWNGRKEIRLMYKDYRKLAS